MKTTRRFFVGAAASAATWIIGFFRARTGLAAPGPADAGMPEPQPDAGTAPRAPASLVQLARERYGKYLDEAQLKLLETKLGESEARSRRLHAFKLANGDEPGTDFRPVRP